MRKAILAGIADNNPNVRQAAAVLAGLSNNTDLAVKVAKLLGDRYWQVQEKAAWALGKLNDRSVIPALMDLLGANEAIMRKRILSTLGNVTEDEAATSEKDDNPLPVKKAAALALARLSPETVVEPLIQAFESPNKDIKVAALGGLGNLKALNAIPLILESLSDPEEKIRQAAATAAGKLRLSEALPALISLTEDKSWSVRMEAVIALNHIKEEGSFQALCARLKDPRPEVRHIAAMAVGNTRRNEAGELLAPLLHPDQPPTVRRSAIAALAGVKAVDKIDLLGRSLNDPDGDVKTEASKAVLRMVERD